VSKIYTTLFFDSIAATIPLPQLLCSQAEKSLGSLQASSSHPCTADTQKINLLHCAHIDFVELEHLWETESTTRIKMIWLTLQLHLLLLDPFFLL